LDGFRFVGGGRMNFFMETDHKRIYMFDMQYCFWVDTYKRGDGAHIWGYLWHILRSRGLY